MARKFNKNIKLLSNLHAKQGNEGFQTTGFQNVDEQTNHAVVR